MELNEEFGELAAFGGVAGKLVVGEHGAGVVSGRMGKPTKVR